MKLLIVFVLFCVQSVHGQVGDGSGITTADSLAAKCKNMCATGLCYLADDTDCRRYIMCNRDDMGTYIPTTMQCAYGAFWAGKLQQAEPKIACDLQANVNCNIDYCSGKLDSEKFALPDNNCRIYHTCENKGLTTKCCEENNSFDPKLNKCILDDNCNATCPIKTDACKSALVKNTTAPLEDSNCRTFWECRDNNPLPSCCKKGEGYDEDAGMCVSTGCNDDCAYPEDPCKKGVERYAIYTEYCGTFMQCNKTSRNERSCCQSGSKFDPKSTDCVLTNENDTCSNTCPPGFKSVCPLKADSTNTSQYITASHDTETTMACAPGSLFQLNTCGCSTMVEAPDNSCNMELDIAFDGPDMVRTGAQNMTQITLHGQLLNNSISSEKGAVFNGKARLEIPFTQQTYSSCYMSVNFQPADRNTGRQALCSNCLGRGLGDPTLDLFIEDGMVKLKVVTNQVSTSGQGATPHNLEVRFEPGKSQVTKVLYTNDTLHLGVKGPNGAVAVNKYLTGGVTVAGNGLEIGGCGKKGDDETTEAGFIGVIYRLQFSKCVQQKWIEEFYEMFYPQGV